MAFSENDLNFMDGVESFDPSTDRFDTFDPKGAIVDQFRDPKMRGKFDAGKGKEGIITLRVKNNKNAARRCELFNSLKHITKIPNPSQYSNTNNYVPLSSGYIAAALGCIGQAGTSPFAFTLPDFTLFDDFTGSLVYVDSALFASSPGTAIKALLVAGSNVNWTTYSDVTVSCSQLPYRQLLDSFQSMVWRVKQTKLQTSSEAQIKNAFDFVYYSPLGGVENNSFEPSEFFLPSNQQTKVIDIPKKYEIDANTAIYIDLEPSEDMQITLFVEAFRNNAVRW